jgi:hypothetical protein
MQRIIKILIFVFLLLILLLQANAFTLKVTKMREKSLISYLLQNDDTVWWNSTELDSEPYTSPFFKIYKLKNMGQAAYGLGNGDFNNDGRIDFVVNWMTFPWDDLAGISIFYGNKTHNFKIEDINFFNFPTEDIEVADFDNDGDDDIIFSCVLDGDNNEYSIKIIWNDCNTFKLGNEIAHFNRTNGYWINPYIAVADFDLDGDVDFIVGANCGKVKLFKNDGTHNFIDSGEIFDYGTASWGLDTGDFNNDGYPDFIVCAKTESGEYPFNDAGHIYLKLNDQTKNCFNTEEPGQHIASLPFPFDYTIGGQRAGSVAILDYNNDNLLDIIYGGDYKIFLLIQQENGSFIPFYAVGLRDRELTWTDYLKEGGFTIGDFNYDGYDDVIVGGVKGDIRLLINNQTYVNIVKPEDRLLYFFGNDDHSLRFPGTKIIIGDIDVIAKGLEPLSRVDFFLNNNLIYSDTNEPFIWEWSRFGFGNCTVTAKAYDTSGEFAGKDTITAWKFL